MIRILLFCAYVMSADGLASSSSSAGGGASLNTAIGMDQIVDGWFHERGLLWPGQAMSLRVEKILHHSRSQYQDILVFQSTDYGNVLVLDGAIQVTERDEFAYQEMIAHLPLYSHPNPKRVLVVGGGDGGVLREIARHSSVEEIVICELDEQVIQASKLHLPSLAKGYQDPRVTVKIMDASLYMREVANQNSMSSSLLFDVIIMDSSDPIGPASALFETTFYENIRDCLAPGGIVCSQGECVWLHLDLIQKLMKAITPIFATVEYAYCSIPTYPSGQIGFVVATKDRGPCSVPARKPDPEVANSLRYYSAEIHQAAFVLPAFAKRVIVDK